jgi:phenylalanyl-tRNA synthetase beta chain
MKISYNWLKHYIDTTNTPEELSEILTDCGLEVESIEPFESVKGGLHNIVVGEVKSKQVHPNADRLNLTTVDIGSGTELHIVCGAANVAVGQKVLVATIGATLYPMSGEPFTIKESKIRGELSQGMICAEDELGLGHSHEGIMVLQENTPVGMAAASYFKIENDVVFEIGLTPNRADAMSHIGVARDIAAVLNKNAANENSGILKFPDVKSFKAEKNDLNIPVEITDPGCTRYSGIT